MVSKQKKGNPAWDAELPIQQSDSNVTNFPRDSIPQADNKNKQNKGKKTKTQHTYTMRSSVRTLSIKVYYEQIMRVFKFGGYDAFIYQLRRIDPAKYIVLQILHDKDYNKDDIREPSAEKPHIHVLIKTTNGNSTKIGTILNTLGIKFVLEDATLRDKRGVEIINDWEAMAVYLTHETKQAQIDGKHVYDVGEINTNITKDQLEELRKNYIEQQQNSEDITSTSWLKLDKSAKQCGYDLGDFDAFLDNLSFDMRSDYKINTVKQSYNRGIRLRIEQKEPILRTCIYVKGPPNVGKTYAARQYFKQNDMSMHIIDGGKTGKFDKMTPNIKAIICDDDTIPNLLNISDNYICECYKRNNDNPAWAGDYVIVTSNLEFSDRLIKCGYKNKDNIKALHSRFFICNVSQTLDKKGNKFGYLELVSPCTRGSEREQLERKTRFVNFVRGYNKIMREYRPDNVKIDYKDINKAVKNQVEQYKEQLSYGDQIDGQYFVDVDNTIREVSNDGRL